MQTLTWFSVVLALMLGVSGATFATIVLFYDLLFREFLVDKERSDAVARIGIGVVVALACAVFVAVVGHGLCRGCP